MCSFSLVIPSVICKIWNQSKSPLNCSDIGPTWNSWHAIAGVSLHASTLSCVVNWPLQPQTLRSYTPTLPRKTKTCYNSFNAIVYGIQIDWFQHRFYIPVGISERRMFRLNMLEKLLSTLPFTLPNSTFIHWDQNALILSVKVQFIISESQMLHPVQRYEAG